MVLAPMPMGAVPMRSGSVILRLLMYAEIFWLSLQLCRDRNRARLALKVLALAGSAYAAYGVVIYLAGSNAILWMEKFFYRELLTSSFINRTSYATFAGISLLAITGHLIQSLGILQRIKCISIFNQA